VVHWSESEAGSVTVTTAAGTYTAERLVICPGPWAPELLGDVGVPLAVQRLVTTWFEPVGGVSPFLPDRHPWWLWDLDGGKRVGFAEFLYGFPAVDGPGGGVKLSRVLEQPCSADGLDRAVSDDEVEAVAALLRRQVAVPLDRLVRAEVCMWTNTPDHHFVLGEHPRHRQVVVAAGCCGAAFKFVPVIGEIVADLAVDGKTAHAIELFAPGRGGVFAEI
jgi:sarcosine oxidase